MTPYMKLPSDLQALVHQMILIESQKGTHPLSKAQIESIAGNVYEALLVDPKATQIAQEAPTATEELVEGTPVESKQVCIGMITINPAENWKGEKPWKYEGINGTHEGAYYMYSHKDEDTLWRICKDGQAIYGYMDNPEQLPPELVLSLFKKLFPVKH